VGWSDGRFHSVSALHILLAVLVYLGFTDLCIIFDIPILRQVTGFFLLTLVPGLLVLSLTRFDDLDRLTHLLLAVGVSVIFLILYGLGLNGLLLAFNYRWALTEVPILVGLNLFILHFVAYYPSRLSARRFDLSLPRFQLSEKVAILPALILPLAGTAGVVGVNLGGGSLPLLLFLFIVLGYVSATALQHRRISGLAYAAMLLFVGLSLALLLAFRSSHLIGTDTHFEYYTFMNTFNAGHWAVFDHSLLDACLSVSILPTIYQAVLAVPPEPMFKALYPILFSCSPLIVFQMSRRYLADHFAYLAGFFFISQLFFIWVTSNARTAMAVLFFMLALMVLFENRIPKVSKRLLVTLFLMGIVFSHYSTSYIVFILLIFAWAAVSLIPSRVRGRTIVTLFLLLIMTEVIVLWYGFATVTPLEYAVNFAKQTLQSIGTIFTGHAERGSDVQSAFGAGVASKGIAHIVQFLATWLTLGSIAIGLLVLVRHFWITIIKKRVPERPVYLKHDFDANFMALAFSAAGLIFLMTVIPFLSTGYEITRVYPLALTSLSVFFVIGGILIAIALNRLFGGIISIRKGCSLRAYLSGLKGLIAPSLGEWKRAEVVAIVVLLLILAPYFLSSTGAMHNLLGTPREITFNNFGPQYDQKYITDADVGAAAWLRNYPDGESWLYTDVHGASPLMSHGNITPFRIVELPEDYPETEGYVFLRLPNWDDGVIDVVLKEWFGSGTSRVSRKTIGMIYTNGEVEILKLRDTPITP
jgi:uncharacterized membrane protein